MRREGGGGRQSGDGDTQSEQRNGRAVRAKGWPATGGLGVVAKVEGPGPPKPAKDGDLRLERGAEHNQGRGNSMEKESRKGHQRPRCVGSIIDIRQNFVLGLLIWGLKLQNEDGIETGTKIWTNGLSSWEISAIDQ